MAAQTISLTEEQQQLVANLVNSGRFSDAQEAVSAGLRTLERQQREYDRKLAVLRAAIDEGMKGEPKDSVVVFAELRGRIRARAEALAAQR